LVEPQEFSFTIYSLIIDVRYSRNGIDNAKKVKLVGDNSVVGPLLKSASEKADERVIWESRLSNCYTDALKSGSQRLYLLKVIS